MAYNDYDSSFNELLEMEKENIIHIKNRKNIHILMTEIYKFLNGLSPPLMGETFLKKYSLYSLRNPKLLTTDCKSAVKYGINSIVSKDP